MQLKYHMITTGDPMPQNHFLWKLEAVLDLTFAYEETSHLYGRKYGRPPIDHDQGKVSADRLSVRHSVGLAD